MKITRSYLRNLIKEEMNLFEIQAPSGPLGPDWGGQTPGEKEKQPGVMSDVMDKVVSATKQGVTDLSGAYKALQKGEDFSLTIPNNMAAALSTWLSKTQGCVNMNEARSVIREAITPAHLIAGLGAGLLALCIIAMMMGYEADVDVGGNVPGGAGHAKIILKAPSGKEV